MSTFHRELGARLYARHRSLSVPTHRHPRWLIALAVLLCALSAAVFLLCFAGVLAWPGMEWRQR